MVTKNLTELFLNQELTLIGRELELERMFIALLKHEKPNILLLGEPGVGKSALVYKLAEMIAKNNCPAALQGYKVIEVNTNALLSGDGYRGVTEKKFQEVIEMAFNKRVILFFDEFHTVTHLGEMANGQTPGLGNTLKTYLTKRNFKVIGATTIKEGEGIQDGALLRRFTKVWVNEPNEDALIKIAVSTFKKYSQEQLTLDYDLAALVSLSKSLDGSNPDKLCNLLDISVAKAKYEGSEVVNSNHVDFALEMMQANPCELEETLT